MLPQDIFVVQLILYILRQISFILKMDHIHKHGGLQFGAKILSAVRNREASASRRLLMYYSYGSFNP